MVWQGRFGLMARDDDMRRRVTALIIVGLQNRGPSPLRHRFSPYCGRAAEDSGQPLPMCLDAVVCRLISINTRQLVATRGRRADRHRTVCLWAGEPRGLACHNFKHLAGWIRGGNWARPKMPL